MTAKLDPLGTETTYAYNNQGLLGTETTSAGNTTYSYDAAGNLTGITYPDGSSVQKSYDPNGQIAQMVDVSGTTNFSYDANGQLTGKTVSGQNAALAYILDQSGNVTEFTLKKNNTTTQHIQSQYDGLNRRTQLTEEVTGGVGTVTYFQYDLNSNLTGISFPNGGGSTYAYDAANQLTQLTVAGGAGSALNKTLDKHSYQYDANGNRTADALTSGKNTYAYDALNRLVSEKDNLNSSGAATSSTKEYQYGFDGAGNRTSLAYTTYKSTLGLLLTPTTTNTSYQYNAGNQLSSVTSGSSATNYTYNGLGRLTGKSGPGGATSFTYNGAGNLKGISGTSGQEAFTYNGFGQRTSGTTPADGTVNYLWSDDTVINAIKSGSSAYDYTYTYGPGGLLNKNSGTTRTYYGVDGRANVTLTEDAVGSKKDTYTYDAFGNFLSKSGSESLTFVGAQGVQHDATSGLYYMNQRWYDPTIGRFISQDVFPADLSDPQSLNRYAYVLNNPLIYTDPTGMSPCTAGDIIAQKKQGKINQEFPGNMRDKTLDEIERLARQGDRDAQKAKKLLKDKRFDKRDNRK